MEKPVFSYCPLLTFCFCYLFVHPVYCVKEIKNESEEKKIFYGETQKESNFKDSIKVVLNDERLSTIKTQLEGIFKNLESSGISEEPFILKIKEGLVKKVQAEKILNALKALYQHYIEALEILRRKKIPVTGQTLDAVCELKKAGIENEHVDRLLSVKIEGEKDIIENSVTMMVLCVIELKKSGASVQDAVSKTIHIYQKDGISGLKKQLEEVKSKPMNFDQGKLGDLRGTGKAGKWGKKSVAGRKGGKGMK